MSKHQPTLLEKLLGKNQVKLLIIAINEFLYFRVFQAIITGQQTQPTQHMNIFGVAGIFTLEHNIMRHCKLKFE